MKKHITTKQITYIPETLIGICLYLLIRTLNKYISIKFSLNNPLFTKELISELTHPLLFKVILLLVSTTVLFVLRFYKKRTAVIFIAIAVILIIAVS